MEENPKNIIQEFTKDDIIDNNDTVAPLATDITEEEGLLNRKNLILALLLFLSLLFFGILLYSVKYYFDNQSSKPATVQSIPVNSSSSSSLSSSNSSSNSSTTSNPTVPSSSSSSSAPAAVPKTANVNADSGLLIRKDDGSLKYPNPTGVKQGSFDDKESVKVDTTKGKKEFTVNNEKLTFVYATGASKDGWVAEKYVVYK